MDTDIELTLALEAVYGSDVPASVVELFRVEDGEVKVRVDEWASLMHLECALRTLKAVADAYARIAR